MLRVFLGLVFAAGAVLLLLLRSSSSSATRRSRTTQRVIAAVLALASAVALVSGVLLPGRKTQAPHAVRAEPALSRELVGRQGDGSVVVSSGQRVTPAGRQVEFPGRPTAVAVRPDGRTMAALTSEGALIVVMDPGTGRIIQQFLPGRVASFTGLVYDPDGKHLTASRASGTLVRASVAADGTLSDPVTIALPNKNGLADPGGLAVSADGSTLYVALSRYNTLGVVDLVANRLVAQIPVDNAPSDVVLADGKAYVSDQGGRRAGPGDRINQSSGTAIVADPVTGGPATGTVSVVDLATQQVRSLPVGLQPTGEYVSGHTLFVTNSSSDTVSVLDTTTDTLQQTINVKPLPGLPLGSQPNAVTSDGQGHLIVSLGRNNALAVYNWRGPRQETAFLGLVPTGAYPCSVAISPTQHRLVVANDLGVGSLGPPDARGGHRSGAFVGSLSLIDLPLSTPQLTTWSTQVLANDQLGSSGSQTAETAPTATPAPVPQRLDDPSTIHHVFYIVKENRTYDQVLGDDTRGNGDSALTSFGKAVTPNEHALVQRFPLLDNFYASGAVSADGHQWDLQANVPDYLEKAYGGFTRSYPYSGGDALAYTATGFLWGDALARGRTVADFGEYASSHSGPPALFGSWSDWYQDYLKLTGKAAGATHVPVDLFQSHSDVPQLDPLLVRDYTGFSLNVPDQYRELLFERQFQQYVATNSLPNLVLMYLPADHTAAAASGKPTPSAMIADNDLALGKIVDTISHSAYWKDSAIFVTEDDAQAGTDHVDGHRTTGFVISPWTTPKLVSHTYYTQTNMIRTIEAILGLPAMNQMDLAAEPMRDLFTSTPDLTSWSAVPNRVPLDQMNPPAPAGQATPEPTPSAPLQQSAFTMQRRWQIQSDLMHFNDFHSQPDQQDPALLDHAIWYASHGYVVPYPGERDVLTPGQVENASAPSPPGGDG